MPSHELPYAQAPQGSNPTTRVILGRRSVREGFADRAVPRPLIEEIVRCGLSAPSSKNARPWRLHVVTDTQLRLDLAADVANADGADSYVPRDPVTGLTRTDWPSSVPESAAALRSAPLAIFVENLGAFSKGRATLASVPTPNLRGSLVAYTFEVLGIGTAIMNMWIAGNSLGLQGVFMGDVCVAEAAISRRLGIERDLVGVLILGYSDLAPSRDRVHYDISDGTRVSWHS